MTLGPTGEARPAGGNTVTPRTAFWWAWGIWVLSLAATATTLVYKPCPPAACQPEQRAGGAAAASTS